MRAHIELLLFISLLIIEAKALSQHESLTSSQVAETYLTFALNSDTFVRLVAVDIGFPLKAGQQVFSICVSKMLEIAAIVRLLLFQRLDELLLPMF